MWLDLVSLGILGLFALVGALRGALASALALASLAAGYGAAIAFGPALAPTLSDDFGIPEILALPVAGSAAFLVTYLSVGIGASLLRRLARLRARPRGGLDRLGGALLGAARGSLLVLLVSWLALWVDVLRANGTLPFLPELRDSKAAEATGYLVEEGLESALAETGAAGRFVARMAARPSEALEGLQGLLDHPGVAALRGDGLFWSYVEHGNVEAALNRGSFVQILRDADLRERLADLGLVEDAAALDAGAFREEAAAVLREVGPRLRGLREDPQLRALVEDPEVVSMLESGDTVALLSHEGFRSLVDRVTSRPGPD